MLASILPDNTLLVASHNTGKAREIAELLAPYAIEVLSAKDFALTPPEETSADYIGNALIKAEACFAATGIPALADDSGFEVVAWDNKPGVHSARLAETEGDFAKAMARIAAELHKQDNPSPACRMVSALVLVYGNSKGKSQTLTTQAEVDGTFVWPPRGDKGFGYDPVFQPIGYGETFAEMDAADKQAISHRHKAFQQLLAQLHEAVTIG